MCRRCMETGRQDDEKSRRGRGGEKKRSTKRWWKEERVRYGKRKMRERRGQDYRQPVGGGQKLEWTGRQQREEEGGGGGTPRKWCAETGVTAPEGRVWPVRFFTAGRWVAV